jgi:hypothetical protein
MVSACANVVGPAAHFAFQPTQPSLVRVHLDNTNLLESYILQPNGGSSVCLAQSVNDRGIDAEFAANPNSQYTIIVASAVTNVGSRYRLEVDCNN